MLRADFRQLGVETRLLHHGRDGGGVDFEKNQFVAACLKDFSMIYVAETPAKPRGCAIAESTSGTKGHLLVKAGDAEKHLSHGRPHRRR